MSLRSQIDSLRARAEQRSQRMQQLAFEMTEVEGALEAANAGSRAARKQRVGAGVHPECGLQH
jgi:hypothetical protein